MRSFEYYTPTKVIFGKDTHLKIGELLKDYNCHKVLIHYGSESAVKSGLIHEISKCLTEAGIDFVTLGGVVPNPRLSKVREGISLCQKESVDFILAVGGGSVIDSAKAIGYGVANPWTDVWNFFLKTEIPNACLPIGAIPTIAASGSEMSGSCVITNEDGWLKLSPEIHSDEPATHLYSAGISDRKWLCRYSSAYHGTLFCQHRNHGDH